MGSKYQVRARVPSLWVCLTGMLLIAGLWILFVGGTQFDEMIVGVGVLLLSCTFLYQVWRTETLELDFALRDLVQAWRIPWYVFTGISEIVAILIKDLFLIKKAASFYRVSGFKTSKSDPRLIGRRVLAIFFTTMAPNFIVVGVDCHQSRMLFHQLKRSSIPKMTRVLGAQPGRPRW